MSPNFSTSTGNNFWELSGIFKENDYQYWFLPVLRPDASAPVVVKIQSPNSPTTSNTNQNLFSPPKNQQPCATMPKKLDERGVEVSLVQDVQEKQAAEECQLIDLDLEEHGVGDEGAAAMANAIGIQESAALALLGCDLRMGLQAQDSK